MKKTIGRTDRASFPDLGLTDIPIKIDTGAYTSSIHCNNLKVENNVLYADFYDENLPRSKPKTVSFTDFATKKVKSSNGVVQNRFKIKSNVKLFGKVYKIALTLADRKKMRNPVLIGRKFLNKKFVVDTEFKSLSYKAEQNEH
jgi:hypothetical protein